MPKLVRRFLKTGIAFLFAGLALGLALSAGQHLGIGGVRYPWIVAHTHILLVGFVMMVIMGVALWMFPKPAAQDERYKPARMEIVYWLMVSGILLRSGAEAALGFDDRPFVHVVAFSGSALEVLGIGLFFLNLLPRIRSPREELSKHVDG